MNPNASMSLVDWFFLIDYWIMLSAIAFMVCFYALGGVLALFERLENWWRCLKRWLKES